jgi:hypothetical protein
MSKHDHHPPGEDHSPPPQRNNPRKSEVITTGTYKTKKTRKEQIARHEDPNKVAQHALPPHVGPRGGLERKADSTVLEYLGERRDGSDSNAHRGRKQSRLHEDHRDWNTPQPSPVPDPALFDHDLHPHSQAGLPEAMTAAEIKALRVRFAHVLTHTELLELRLMPVGSELEQGTHYLDLADLAAGELVGMGGMEVQPHHYYVAKNDTEYVLWHKLAALQGGSETDGNTSERTGSRLRAAAHQGGALRSR